MQTLRNNVQLIGNLGQDPEIINLESGKKLAKFSIATNESYKDKNGEKVEQTYWHNIVAWDRLADFVKEYLERGQLVSIEGSLRSRSWTNKDGTIVKISEIVASQIIPLGTKKET